MKTLLIVLKYFLENPGSVCYGRELALILHIPERSTYNYLERLVNAGLLKREHNNYKLDPEFKRRLFQNIKLNALN